MKLRLFLAIPLLASACGIEPFENAIPSERSVTIQSPEGSGSALSADAALGEMSDYYRTTRAMTRGVNGGVRGLVLLLRSIVQNPPTSEEGDTQIWGPGADALDPVIYRLRVTRQDEGIYSYALEYRPRGSEDADANYVPLVEGNSDVSSGVNDGTGHMIVRIDNWVAVEPGACGSGTLDIDYDTRSEPQFLAVAFDNFSDHCNTDAEHRALAAATYYYSRNADGSGNFQFTATGDVDAGTVLAGVDETFSIRSRWLASGEGRSDVMISGGDLQANHGLAQATASECWDAMFLLSYADIDPIAIDPSHADLADESACAAGLTAAEYASDI